METVEIELSHEAAEQLHFLLSEELTDSANDLRPLAKKRGKTVSEYSPSHAMLGKTCRTIGAAID